MGTAGHEAGNILNGQDAFQARMEAQCEEIERYRLLVLREEGRELSLEQAALEWIEGYADTFARDSETS
jgi:hypothetical protein